eukprot:111154_1
MAHCVQALYLLDELITKFTILCDEFDFSTCRFDSSRLSIHGWRMDKSLDLPSTLHSILTPEVTNALPDNWTGTYDINRCKSFITERDNESPTLLIVEKSTNHAIGLMIVFVMDNDIRLGYLLKQSCWGKGYATEVVRSFVSCCRKHCKRNIKYISGGCDINNVASQKVLIKNGFHVVKELSHDTEVLLRLDL